MSRHGTLTTQGWVAHMGLLGTCCHQPLELFPPCISPTCTPTPMAPQEMTALIGAQAIYQA